MDGLFATDNAGTPSYAVGNNHGDVVGTTNGTGAYSSNPGNDEFGRGGAPTNRLGWAGKAERFTENTATGIIRMGVRLYDPNIGRFLSVDPVAAGSCNDYDYTCGDPVNGSDLGGTFRYGYWRGIRCPHWRHHRDANRWAERHCGESAQGTGFKKASFTTGYKAPPRLVLMPWPDQVEFTVNGVRISMPANATAPQFDKPTDPCGPGNDGESRESAIFGMNWICGRYGGRWDWGLVPVW
jgi:RHS repeat-associated protein